MDLIKKLWNGDFSLPITFWLFHVLGNGILNLIDTSLASSGLYDRLLGQDQYFLIMTFVIFGLCYFILTCTGVWRSSVKYGQSGGSKLWSGAAQIAVIIGIVRTIMVLYSAF